MKNKKIISIYVCLVKAEKKDCFKEDIPISGKLFFCKNYETNKFSGFYTIPCCENFSSMEVIQLLYLGVLFYPSLELNNNLPTYKFFLQEADDFDFIYSDKNLNMNKMYFIRKLNELYGPYYINEKNNLAKIKKDLEDKILYVPCKKQNFEQKK